MTVQQKKTRSTGTSKPTIQVASVDMDEFHCFSHNLEQHLKETGITTKGLCAECGIQETLLDDVIHHQLQPTQSLLRALSTSPSLKLPYQQMMTWLILDETLHYANTHHQVIERSA